MSGLRSSRNLLAPPTLIRAGNLARPAHFWTLGVKPDPTVPHTWGLGHRRVFPRGGSCCIIYIDLTPGARAKCIIATKSFGIGLLLPYTLVSLMLDFIQVALAVQKNLEMAIIIILNNP